MREFFLLFSLTFIVFCLATFSSALFISMLKQAVNETGRVLIEYYLTRKRDIIRDLEEELGKAGKNFTHN